MNNILSNNFNLLYAKILRFALYQERCTQDIKRKLLKWKVPARMAARMLTQLTQEGVVDDQCFANTYVRGKFRVNRWGRNRIVTGLRARHLPEAVIREALREIAEEEYLDTIRALIQRKNGEINPEKTLNKREKIINFVVGKGFEPDLVLRMMQEIKI